MSDKPRRKAALCLAAVLRTPEPAMITAMTLDGQGKLYEWTMRFCALRQAGSGGAVSPA